MRIWRKDFTLSLNYGGYLMLHFNQSQVRTRLVEKQFITIEKYEQAPFLHLEIWIKSGHVHPIVAVDYNKESVLLFQKDRGFHLIKSLNEIL